MSQIQKVEDNMTCYTNYDQTTSRIRIILDPITETPKSEVFLTLPKNESLEEYEKEMDLMTDLCLEDANTS